MSPIASTLLAAAVACAPWPAHAAPPPQVRLEVDTSALPESSATNTFARWLTQDQTHTILDGGVEVSPDAPIAIRVVVRRYGEHDGNYEATLVLADAERGVVYEERVVTCELCTDGQLITKVSPEVARLAARVLYAPVGGGQEAEQGPQEAPPEPEEQEPGPATEPGSEPATPVRPPSKLIGALGAWGIASAAAGLGATGVGIGLALAPDRTRPAQENVERRSTRPVGLALVSIGTVLMVTGAVLVAVDVRRRERARRISILPELSIGSVSVSFSMRF